VAMPKTGGISMAVGMFVPMMLWVARDDFVSAVLWLGGQACVIVVIGERLRTDLFNSDL
jgi:hypothetical protein